MSTRISRLATYWLSYVVVLGGVSLLTLELAVRQLELAPRLPSQYARYVEDPFLPHRPRPDSVVAGRSAAGEFEFRYEHNSQGLRNREVQVRKPPGTFRILGLGDSFTYGAGTDADETYLSRLESMLNDRPGHPPVEVINAGISRFFPEAERLYLEHYGLRFSPDLVVVAFVPNDVIDQHLGLQAIEVLPDGRLVSNHGARLLQQLGPLTLWIYEHLQASRIPIRSLLRSRLERKMPVRWSEIFQPDGFHEEAWQEVERQYARMTGVVREHGAELALMHLPLSGPWDERSAYPARRLAAWARAHDVVFVDALPALSRRSGEALLYWPKDGHPTGAAHAVIARTLYETLVETGLVP